MFHSQENYAGRKVSCLLVCLAILLPFQSVDARWTRRPRRTTTPRTTTTSSSTVNPDRHQHVHHWPPLVAPPPAQPESHPQVVVVQKPSYTETSPRLIDSFDQRSLDGQYEFRYQLDNGNTRYERAYWLPVGKDLVLAKKGYYSVPLPNDKYSTVFYTADHRGYHVDMQTLSKEQPLLPRSLEVPGMERDVGSGTGTGMGSGMGMGTDKGTKRNSISDPERNELDVEVDEDVDVEVDEDVDASEAGTELVPNAVNQVETETEPSTLANDILATEAPADSHDDDDVDDDEGASN
ncbi:uncharacterized protein LOC108044909 [Drosophila rhopaloa]|uniref:Uncharacterized protein LOC108044909 n=1 Tax=Drosophila rhopaloa TaxID=1041015 RepID=A0A6P4ES95_DRORH|nr:uncharacterized protein LOC108044909 [Drosophila rhopaloa]